MVAVCVASVRQEPRAMGDESAQAPPPEVTLWRSCHGPAACYAAAWLARKETVLETLFGDKLGMEYHDYYMYNQGGNGHPRECLKSADAAGLWVNHLSEYEHQVGRKAKKEAREELVASHLARVEAEACGRQSAGRWPSGIEPPIAAVPFWGGKPETDADGKTVGNSHSRLGRELKALQLRATLCSIEAVFPGARVFVAVANADDAAAATRSPKKKPFAVEILDVEHGAYLSFAALRHLQSQLEAGAWTTDLVYFTEADQVVSTEFGPAALAAAVGQHVYVAPNRLNEEYPEGRRGILHIADYSPFHKKGRYTFNMNICNGELVAVFTDRALPSPPVSSSAPVASTSTSNLRTKTTRTKVNRGGPISWPASADPERGRVTTSDVRVARRAVEARDAKRRADDAESSRYGYASGPPRRRGWLDRLEEGKKKEESPPEVFVRCWDAVEFQRARAWFAHVSCFRGADFQRLTSSAKAAKEPLVSAVTALIDAKRSPSWHVWPLATAEPYAFAVCSGTDDCRDKALLGTGTADKKNTNPLAGKKSCRGAPSLDDGRINSPAETLALMPWDDKATNLHATLTSVCAALDAFDAVVVGVCTPHARDRAQQVVDMLVADRHRITVASVDCDYPESRFHATFGLAVWARAQLARHFPAVAYLALLPVGDVVTLADVKPLRAVVSPLAFVLAHTPAARPICGDPSLRDWVVPLDGHNRSLVSFDATAFLLVPR